MKPCRDLVYTCEARRHGFEKEQQALLAIMDAMDAEIAQLMERYGDAVVAKLKNMIAKPKKHTKAETIETLVKCFDDLLCEPKIVDAKVSLKLFKAEAVEAWKRAHPNGMAKRTNAYTEFVKANMQSVKNQNPSKTHGERMKIMGQLWSKYKAAREESESSTFRSQSHDHDQQDQSEVTTRKPKARKAEMDLEPAPTQKKARKAKARRSVEVVENCRVTRNSSKK